jgi:hypothetical protein
VIANSNVLYQASKIKEWWGDDAICKKDGSLGAYGIEICTSPGTLDWHREKWKKFLSIPYAGMIYAWSSPACGLHVHISRTAFNCLSLSKLMMFMNAGSNQPFITLMSGRGPSHFSQAGLKQAADLQTGHYDCVNTANHDTIEIRIFKSSLSVRRVLMDLDMVDSLVAFCNDNTYSIQRGIDPKEYEKFVLAQESRWPYLTSRFKFGVGWLRGDVPGLDAAVITVNDPEN